MNIKKISDEYKTSCLKAAKEINEYSHIAPTPKDEYEIVEYNKNYEIKLAEIINANIKPILTKLFKAAK